MKPARFVVLAAVVGLLGVATLARPTVADPPALHYSYLGPHPIPPEFGGGFCYIEFPHVHVYTPTEPQLYREHDGAYAFVGDPAPVDDYDGPRVAYYGPHPIPPTVVVDDDDQPVYCYIKGPHYHSFSPVVTNGFVDQDNVYYYNAPLGPTYYTQRPVYEAPINAYYQPIQYVRPNALEPPAGYVVEPPPPPPGLYVEAPVAEAYVAPPVVGVAVAPTAAVWAAPYGAVVATPGIVVATPGVVAAPGVVAVAPVGGVAVVPPMAGVVVTPPAAGVVISPGGIAAAITPPSIAIGIGGGVVVGGVPTYIAPPPPMVVGPAPVILVPHDNGRHEGWEHGDDNSQGDEDGDGRGHGHDHDH
jgi:hypothetical protein